MSKEIKDILFHIEGEVFFENSEKNNGYEREALYMLQKERIEIVRKIEYQLSQRFNTDVRCELNFEEGSIIVSGLVILKWISLAAGVFSFIDYASRIINWIIKRTINNELRRFPFSRSLTVVISSFSDFDRNGTETLRNTETEPTSLFSLRTILIAITLINLILILGGNIYNFVTVESTKDQYLKAKEEVLEINSDLKSLVTDLKLKELETRSEIEALPDKIESEYYEKLVARKDSILNKMNSIEKELIILSDSAGYYQDPSKKIIQLVQPPPVKEKKIRLTDLDNQLTITLSISYALSIILILILFFVKKGKRN
ncbi:hypothetical protein [Echinicola rosea]|uniref:Uncharacterized protein n=1 Tax=Echinicola rosea TaxID=1807691 RepID=A0ABQ1UM20_9BACT|nr:hypothetical protein [Echinicola rosea]GGF21384.1 hypothetical protein GCM10011339_06770 [Echinicola rosea]